MRAQNDIIKFTCLVKRRYHFNLQQEELFYDLSLENIN